MSSFSLRKRFAHMRNKHMDEGALRNVLLEIQGVTKPMVAANKQINVALGEITAWASTQKPVIATFLGEINTLEADMVGYSQSVIDEYSQYLSHWRTILDERKELRNLIEEHKKAEAAVEIARKKLQEAQKMEAKTVQKASASGVLIKPNSEDPSAALAPAPSVPPTPARVDSAAAPTTVTTVTSTSVAASPEAAAGPASAAATPVLASSTVTTTTVSIPVGSAAGDPASSALSSIEVPAGSAPRAVTPTATPPLSKAPSVVAVVSSPDSGANDPDRAKAMAKLAKRSSNTEINRSALKTAEENEQRLEALVEAKILDTQKEIHSNLRQAYLASCRTRMAYHRKCASTIESQLAIVSNFPDVTGVDAEGNFLTAPAESSVDLGALTVWMRGEVLRQNLAIERESARYAIESERSIKAKDIAQLQAKHSEEITELTHRLQAAEKQHADLISSLKSASEQTAATLQDRLAQLTAEKHELARMLQDMQDSVLQLITKDATASIAEAVSMTDRDLTDVLRQQIAAAIKLNDHIMATRKWEKGDFIVTMSAFSRAVSGIIGGSIGLAQTIELGKGRAIIRLAQAMGPSASGLVTGGIHLLMGQASDATRIIEHGSSLGNGLTALERQLAELASTADIPTEVAQEISKAQLIVTDAIAQLEALDAQSRETDKDRWRELHQNLLSVGGRMIQFAKDVINAALADKPVLSTGMSRAEAALQHKAWLAAMRAAVDSVVENVPLWTEWTRQVVKQHIKHDELHVATRAIAACSAQLLAIARTKSDGLSGKSDIEKASDGLVTTSHAFLTAIREANSFQLASVLLDDFAALSENQAKKLIMTTQVEILRLESSLEKERERLGKLRRLQYGKDKDTAAV